MPCDLANANPHIDSQAMTPTPYYERRDAQSSVKRIIFTHKLCWYSSTSHSLAVHGDRVIHHDVVSGEWVACICGTDKLEMQGLTNK